MMIVKTMKIVAHVGIKEIIYNRDGVQQEKKDLHLIRTGKCRSICFNQSTVSEDSIEIHFNKIENLMNFFYSEHN